PETTGCVIVPDSTTEQYVCHGVPGDGAEYDGMTPEDQTAVTRVMVNAAKAIAAYQRQLRCGESRFDDWIDGDDAALDDAELRGAPLFIGKARCATSHARPNLTDDQSNNVGLAPKHVAPAFDDQGDDRPPDGLARLGP